MNPDFTPAGVYLGKAGPYHADLSRLDSVVRRITLALFAREFGQRLPDNSDCKVYTLSGFSEADVEGRGRTEQALFRPPCPSTSASCGLPSIRNQVIGSSPIAGSSSKSKILRIDRGKHASSRATDAR
jgi:hypothetical protein